MMDIDSALSREPPVSPEPLFEQIDLGMQGLARVAALAAAFKYSFFDHLTSPLTPDELARITGTRINVVAPICRILEDMGFVTSSQGKYHSTLLAITFLARTSPYCQGAYVEKTWRHVCDLWLQLPEILVLGPVSYQAAEFFGEMSLPAMAENALCGRLQRVTREITALPRFHSFRRMIDLGGGHGLYAIMLSSANPGLHAWVFDLPYIIPLASRYISQYGATRVHTSGGNFFTDDIGNGYDLVLSSSNPSGKRIDMIRRIADALNPKGVFVNVQSMGRESFDMYQALEWQLWSIEGKDRGEEKYTREEPYLTDEYRAALSNEGFSILVEKDITDDYHKGARVRMIIAEKKE